MIYPKAYYDKLLDELCSLDVEHMDQVLDSLEKKGHLTLDDLKEILKAIARRAVHGSTPNTTIQNGP
jgi:hypothetical protein